MKRKLVTVALALIVAGGLGFLSVAVYARYEQHKQNQKVPEPTITVAESDKRLEAAKTSAQAKYDALVDQYNLEVNQCSKGYDAYGKLTAAQKAQTAAPLCGSVLAE